jgi:hypothetical protein
VVALEKKTPTPRSITLLQNLAVAHLAEKFPSAGGSRKFNTAFTRAHCNERLNSVTRGDFLTGFTASGSQEIFLHDRLDYKRFCAQTDQNSVDNI